MWPPCASLPVTLTLSSISLALISTAFRSKKLTIGDLVDIFSRCARGRFIKLHACGYLFFENNRGFSGGKYCSISINFISLVSTSSLIY